MKIWVFFEGGVLCLSHGIMEWWNDAILVFKGYYPFLIKVLRPILQLTQHSIIPKPIFPVFQHSNIPIGAKPLNY
jgi:hypothetical protein